MQLYLPVLVILVAVSYSYGSRHFRVELYPHINFQGHREIIHIETGGGCTIPEYIGPREVSSVKVDIPSNECIKLCESRHTGCIPIYGPQSIADLTDLSFNDRIQSICPCSPRKKRIYTTRVQQASRPVETDDLNELELETPLMNTDFFGQYQ